jgi:hypothetical protein
MPEGLIKRHVELLDIDIDAMKLMAINVSPAEAEFYRNHKDLFDTANAVKKLVELVDLLLLQ